MITEPRLPNPECRRWYAKVKRDRMTPVDHMAKALAFYRGLGQAVPGDPNAVSVGPLTVRHLQVVR